MTKKILPRIGLVLGVAALFFLPAVVTDRYSQHIMVLSCIYVILTCSWNLLSGYAGLLNLGHAAFFGIGAYASALLAINTGLSPWLGLFAGGVVAALFGALLGIPSFRLSGPYLAITTIGFSEIMRMVAMNWVNLTRGSLGLYDIPPLTPLRISKTLSIEFVSERNAYYVGLIFVILVLVMLKRLVRSEFGLTIEAMREDEKGAESIGVGTSQYKLAVFMVSAFLAGFAGAFYAHYVRLISPEMLSLGETFTILTMATIGGLGTLSGPIVGAVLLTIVAELLRFLEELINIDIRMVIYGALLMVTIIFMRKGLVGVASDLKKRLAQGDDE